MKKEIVCEDGIFYVMYSTWDSIFHGWRTAYCEELKRLYETNEYKISKKILNYYRIKATDKNCKNLGEYFRLLFGKKRKEPQKQIIELLKKFPQCENGDEDRYTGLFVSDDYFQFWNGFRTETVKICDFLKSLKKCLF